MSEKAELRLSIPTQALPALRAHPIIMDAVRLGDEAKVTTVYYDKPNFRLRARKIVVAVQSEGAACLQMVSVGTPSVGGLSMRSDWVQPHATAFDFAHIDDAALARLLTRHAARLVPVFTAQVHRDRYRYSPCEGVSILMLIDHGEIAAGARSATISELELVVETGDGLDLLELAGELAAVVSLMPNDLSLVERGYRLITHQTVQPLRAERSAIRSDQTVLDAFLTLANACICQWQGNLVVAMEEGGQPEPEVIHQVRVGLRRLRSALKVFAPALPDEFVSEWQGRLRENASRFDAARDLDVFQAELLDPVAFEGLVSQEAWVHLQECVDAARRTARAATQDSLDHALQGQLILRLLADLHRLAAGCPQLGADLSTFATQRLSRLRKRGRRRFAGAAQLAPAQLHRLRIVLKELRYAMQFFVPLFSDKAVLHYLDRLARAQTSLGFLQDMEVARARLQGWAQDDPALGTAVGFVLGWHAPRYADLRRRALHDCEPVLWGKVPWKLS